jgi:phenylpropionate dioxygenase-like ring-hydroxylating dioxygenase large terminal subunit
VSALPTTIDPRRYVSREFQERERQRLWPRVWLLAAHRSELAAPGAFVTLEVGAETFLVVRGAERARAFHNVCVHRGTELCAERRGWEREHACPYHGWRYDLDGKLVAGVGAEAAIADRSGLSEIRCEERAGFVWLRAAPEGLSLDDFLGPLRAALEALDPGALRLVADRSYPLDGNWKLSADVHNEALHLPSLHPQLSELVDVDAIRWEPLGRHARMSIPIGVPGSGPWAGRVGPTLRHLLDEHGIDVAALESDTAPIGEAVRAALRRAVGARAAAAGVALGGIDPACKLQLYVFPHVQLNASGLDLELYRHRPHPSDPLRSTLDELRYQRTPAGAPMVAVRHELCDPAGPARMGRESALEQDLAIVSRVQRGLLSSGCGAPRLHPLEAAIAHMHAGIDAFLDGDAQ